MAFPAFLIWTKLSLVGSVIDKFSLARFVFEMTENCHEMGSKDEVGG